MPPSDYNSNAGRDAELKTVGMAQNINIDDTFGSRAENTIGSPLPILAPGYQQTTIRIEKATIDGADFRNLGAFNPLWAHIGETYSNTINISRGDFEIPNDAGSEMYPFMFVLRTKNKISNSAVYSNVDNDNTPAGGVGTDGERSNPFGIYACVLQSATITANSREAVIMDSMTAIARPVSGTWLNENIRDAFKRRTSGEDTFNGMSTVVYNVLYGYNS